jgi:hypothetical protein
MDIVFHIKILVEKEKIMKLKEVKKLVNMVKDVKVNQINFPNTAQLASDMEFFKVGRNCEEIRKFHKSGECANVGWFAIIKDGKLHAEIKESVCDIYHE